MGIETCSKYVNDLKYFNKFKYSGSTHIETQTHTQSREFLHVFDTLGSGCAMYDLLTLAVTL